MSPSLYINATIAALALSIGLTTGWKVNGWRLNAALDDYKADILEATDALEAKEIALADSRSKAIRLASVLEVERNREQETIEVEVEREVIVYRESDAATECGVDSDGVRIINKSAGGDRVRESRAPAGSPDGALSGPGSIAGAGSNVWRDSHLRHEELFEASCLLQSPALAAGMGQSCDLSGGAIGL